MNDMTRLPARVVAALIMGVPLSGTRSKSPRTRMQACTNPSCAKLTRGGGMCFTCETAVQHTMGGSAKKAGQAENLGAREGAPLTSQAARLAKQAGCILLALLLAGCCSPGRRGPCHTPRATCVQPQANAATAAGAGVWQRELERAKQIQSRLGDEIASLAKQLRDVQASRDQLNEGNSGLLNQLAREREEVARLKEAMATPIATPIADTTPAADAPPTRPDSDAPAPTSPSILPLPLEPWAVAILTTLGVSPPLAYAGWLLLRIVRRRRARQRNDAEATELQRLRKQVDVLLSTRPPAQSEVPPTAGSTFHLEVEEHEPIERDDREGRELLRLSQLEGRDPLQDAIAGRLIRNRLDAFAESASDPQKAQWAQELSREVDQRFNEVAPTKFSINEKV